MAKSATTSTRPASPAPIAPQADSPKRPRGRPPGPSGRTLLTDSNAATARALQAAGKTHAEIAAQLNCGITSVIRLIAMSKESPMTPFTLTRTGLAPLQFTGTLRTSVSGQYLHSKPGVANNDYWTIAIYDTAGRHVVEIVYHKAHKGVRTEHHTVEPTDNVQATLLAYNPLSVLAGFPKGDRFEASQAKLEESCKRQYADLVSQALKEFPEALPDAEFSEAQLFAWAERHGLEWTGTADEILRPAVMDARQMQPESTTAPTA